jgi:hypothetical protein
MNANAAWTPIDATTIDPVMGPERAARLGRGRRILGVPIG